MMWRGGWKGRNGEGSGAAVAGFPQKQWADPCCEEAARGGWAAGLSSLRMAFLQMEVESETPVTAVAGPLDL